MRLITERDEIGSEKELGRLRENRSGWYEKYET